MKENLSLLRSKLKRDVLMLLEDKELSPVMIAKQLKKPRPSISRIILELKDKDYVYCIDEKKDRWRFYKATPKGKKTLDDIKKYV